MECQYDYFRCSIEKPKKEIGNEFGKTSKRQTKGFTRRKGGKISGNALLCGKLKYTIPKAT